MKTSVIRTALAVILSSCFVCLGQSYSLQWKANNISVSFSDQNLNPESKESIVSDLQHCFQGWATNAEIRLISDGEVTNYMYYGTENPYYRDGVDFPKNITTNATGGIALQIPKALSDAYTNAFTFAAANSNIVAAAYEFVAFVSSSNFVSMSSNALPGYILYKDSAVTSNVIVELAPQLVADLRCQTYYPPSILGFYYSAKGPSATNLWMQVPCSIPTGWGSLGWHGSPVLWHDGKWKFCTWEDWVP